MSKVFQNIVFSLLIICFTSTQMIQAKTLTIPGDANSLQEALELAQSEDVIEVNQPKVDWCICVPSFDPYHKSYDCYDSKGIQVTEKNLTIVSPEGSEITMSSPYRHYDDIDNTMLYLDNAQLTFINLNLPFPMITEADPYISLIASPLHIESGTLILRNCDWRCLIKCTGNLILDHTTIFGYSWLNYFTDGVTTTTPALEIGPSKSARVDIIDSTIECTSWEGYRSILINDLDNSAINFTRSTIIAGVMNTIKDDFDLQTRGSDAIEIHDSQDSVLAFDNSKILASSGYDTFFRSDTHTYEPAGDGGDAVSIYDSSLSILCNDTNSIFSGGDGGNGKAFKENFWNDSSPAYTIDAKNGGHGFYLSNSHVSFSSKNILDLAVGGKKGLGATAEGFTAQDGIDGQPIFADENSTYTFPSTATNWQLY